MVPFAPRISQRLLDELERIDDDSRPIAELHRRLGRAAARLGLPQPSYERVRQLVGVRRSGGPSGTLFVLYQSGGTFQPEMLVERLVELARSRR